MANNFLGTGQNAKTVLSSKGALSGAGGIANGMAGAVNSVMTGGNKTAVGGVMQGLGSAVSGIPGIGGLVGAGLNILGGITDAMFGSNLNQEAINNMQSSNANQSGYSSKASSNDELLGDWSGFNVLGNINKSDVGTEGWFSNAATDKTNELNTQREQANKQAVASFGNTAGNISAQNQLQQMSQYYAKGGNLNIKRNNRGKIMSLTGGNIFSKGGAIHSGDGVFSNGVTSIGNGGSHEENPNMGVPFGTDQEGTPNLVEQGEVVFNNYVFSKRILANGGFLREAGLSDRYKKKPYADIATKLSKESTERPNDPISTRGLFDSMLKLQIAQELQKEQDDMKQYRQMPGNMFAGGGSFVPSQVYKTRAGAPEVAKIDLSNTPHLMSQMGRDNTIKNMQTSIAQQIVPQYTTNRETSFDRRLHNSIPSYLKYAPALGAGIGVMTDALGLTNKPDFEEANMILGEQTQVSPKPLGNYMEYKPFDRDFYTNKLNAQSAASRSAIANQSGGNRGAAMAGILASDYNSQNAMGDMFRQAEEYNLGQRQKATEFNRSTDMFNSQSDMRAQEMNTYNRRRGLEVAAQMRAQEKARSAAGRSANLTNLFDSLGEVGKEEGNKDMMQWLERNGVLKSQMFSQPKSKIKAKGGKIKRGYTY